MIDQNAKNHTGKKSPNWAVFRCRPAELRLSFPISEINNYDGSFYSRSKCESDAKRLVSRAYAEASLASAPENLYNIAYRQIMDFEGDCVETAVTDRFRAEIEDGLKKIPEHRLKDFDYYYKLVEYECYESCEDTENWFSALISGSLHTPGWNYSGYEAYLKIEKDFRFIAEKHAMAATRTAFIASRKMISQNDQ